MLPVEIFCLTLMISQQREYFKLRRRRTRELRAESLVWLSPTGDSSWRRHFIEVLELMVNKHDSHITFVLLSLVSNNLPNRGRGHSKLFTNCHVSWDTLYRSFYLLKKCWTLYSKFFVHLCCTKCVFSTSSHFFRETPIRDSQFFWMRIFSSVY